MGRSLLLAKTNIKKHIYLNTPPSTVCSIYPSSQLYSEQCLELIYCSIALGVVLKTAHFAEIGQECSIRDKRTFWTKICPEWNRSHF